MLEYTNTSLTASFKMLGSSDVSKQLKNNSYDNIKKYQQLRYQRADMLISLSFQNVSKLLKFD